MLLSDRILAVTFAISIGLLGVGGYNQRVEKCNNWHAPLEYPEYCDGILENEANKETYLEFPSTL